MAAPNGGQIGMDTGTTGAVDKDARMWAMLAHLSTFTFFLTGIGAIVGPLVVWLIKKDESPFVDAHGKEALNFNISVAIYGIVAGLLVFIGIGLLLVPAVLIFWGVMAVIAAIRANAGEYYQYPLTIRFIK